MLDVHLRARAAFPSRSPTGPLPRPHRSAPLINFRTTGDPLDGQAAVLDVIESMGREYPRGLSSLDDHINAAFLGNACSRVSRDSLPYLPCCWLS